MRKKILSVLIAALTVAALCGCTSTHTSTTEVNVQTTTDEGTKDYNFKSENNNGEITTESTVNETPAGEDAEDVEEGEETALEDDDPVADAAEYVDDRVYSVWDKDGCQHRVSYDPDEIYVHICSDAVNSKDDLDEETIRNEVLPAWLDEISSWRAELDERGLENVELCLQYVNTLDADEIEVFFTIEGGEVTGLIFDE